MVNRPLVLSHRFTLMISPEELKAIEDWQFENRVKSTGEAIRQLCRIATVCCEQCFTVETSEDDIPS